jgi:hypothetical protein
MGKVRKGRANHSPCRHSVTIVEDTRSDSAMAAQPSGPMLLSAYPTESLARQCHTAGSSCHPSVRQRCSSVNAVLSKSAVAIDRQPVMPMLFSVSDHDQHSVR